MFPLAIALLNSRQPQVESGRGSFRTRLLGARVIQSMVRLSRRYEISHHSAWIARFNALHQPMRIVLQPCARAVFVARSFKYARLSANCSSLCDTKTAISARCGTVPHIGLNQSSILAALANFASASDPEAVMYLEANQEALRA